MSHLYSDHRSGCTQLEDVIHAVHALHDVFPGTSGDGMPTSQQLQDFWFLMAEVVQRLDDIFALLMHERRSLKE